MLRVTLKCLLIAGLCLATASGVAQGFDAPSGIRTKRISEKQLRSLIREPVTPVLRPEDLPTNSGPLVAEVTISSTGKILFVSILDAPSMQAARVVQSALKKWKFRPQGSASSDLYVGKLTFYFHVVVDEVRVRIPT